VSSRAVDGGFARLRFVTESWLAGTATPLSQNSE
jgi:hypothetical protein